MIAGAGLDVFEGMEALHKEVADNVIRFLDGEAVESIVNNF